MNLGKDGIYRDDVFLIMVDWQRLCFVVNLEMLKISGSHVECAMLYKGGFSYLP